MTSTPQSTLVSTPEEKAGRRAGRDARKDELRREIRAGLERSGLAVGPAWSRIPAFVGGTTMRRGACPGSR